MRRGVGTRSKTLSETPISSGNEVQAHRAAAPLVNTLIAVEVSYHFPFLVGMEGSGKPSRKRDWKRDRATPRARQDLATMGARGLFPAYERVDQAYK